MSETEPQWESLDTVRTGRTLTFSVQTGFDEEPWGIFAGALGEPGVGGTIALTHPEAIDLATALIQFVAIRLEWQNRRAAEAEVS